ncbi:rhodanese-like domain-containing protein [Chryseolinea sp. H1M3-3]|uniref:rhodanese-like domain-containing protein n=1 Tax=Chryseolinea sp. H1M3-3 TaxID=3034144 RepID=UPI0023EAC050|nr:rhodanese-like domain-containing protein [Chryseolinea sp. H1M3-3]
MGIAWPAFSQTAFDEKLKHLYRYSVPVIKVEDLQRKLIECEKIILLDIRTADEFNVSHIPSALFVEYNSFSAKGLDTLDHEAQIVIYCSVGYRSERIGEKLIEAGFANVRNLYGGIFEWVNKGYPILNAAGAPTLRVHTYNRNWSQWLLKGVKVY